MGAQGLEEPRQSPGRSVVEREYFGADLSAIENADVFGLEPEPETDLYRVSYLYLLVFGNTKSSTDYGGIQVRAQTYLYLEDGAVPTRLQRIMQRAAHRGAALFNTDVEHPVYGGYLEGFNPVENGAEYRNWEVEPMPASAQTGTTPGKIEWTTEIYLEVEGTNYADLSGVGSGVANPWRLKEHEQPPVPGIEAQQEVWKLVGFNEGKSSYQVAPPGHTQARQRSRQLHGKVVYINGLRIGSLDVRGRTWLKDEYAGGLTYRGDNSRESLIEQTVATPQALRIDGNLYKIDESPDAVHLVTARAKPDNFDPVDPDDVDVDRQVQPGQPGRTIRLLSLPEPDDAVTIECRQDDELIRHLGYSTPVYEHDMTDMWAWPGFRPIEEWGAIQTPEDDRDDGQAGLDAFGGDE